MDVLDLQGKITLDTSEYEAAVQRAVTLGTTLSQGLQNAANAGANQLQTSINNVGQSAGQMGTAVNQAADAAGQLGQATGEANANVGQLGQGMNNADQQSNNFANTIQNAVSVALGTLFTQAINKAKDALVGFAKESVQVGMGFDSAMSQVAATMGVTADEIGGLRDFAKEMGSTTAFSATEAAEALNYMALAGYDAEKSMKMLPNVLQLAASGGMSLAKASDQITDAQSALGLSMDETTEMVNKMAMAASKSNTSVTQLGDAMLQIGGTAKKLKGGTTELATILGILADNGMKGAEGGTHLRNMMNSLMSPTKDATEMMENLNVSLYDSEGNMRSLNDVFLDLRTAMDEMATQQERDKVISTIFNARDMKAAEAMLANVGDRYNELSGYIDQAAGSAEKMANTQLDNLQGDVTLFKSAVEGAQIAVSERLEPALRKVTQVGAKAVSEMAQAFGEHGLGAAIDAAKKAIWDGFGEETAKKIYAVEAATKAALAAFIAYKTTVAATKASSVITGFFTDATTGAVSFAAGIEKVKTAIAGLNVTMAATTAVITAVAVGISAYFKSLTAAIEMPKNAYDELDEAQQKTIDGIKEIVSANEESRISFEKTNKEVDKQYEYYDKLKNRLYELDSAENLSADDKARMKAIVEELNGSIEGLNITIDKETGHLKTEKRAIDDTINSMKRKAKEAVAEKKLMDIYEKQAGLEESLEKANRGRADAANELMKKQNELSEATKKYNELNEKAHKSGFFWDERAATKALEDVNRIQEEVDSAEGKLAHWRTTWREAHEGYTANANAEKNVFEELGLTMGGVLEKNSELTESIEQQSGAVEQFGNKYEMMVQVVQDADSERVTTYAKIRDKTYKWSEDQVKAVAAVIDEYKEYRKTVEESVKGSVSIFEEFEQATAVDLDKIMRNMQSNTDGVREWTDNIRKLRKEGILPDELIDQWEEMGVASQGYVKALAEAAPEVQQQFVETWSETQRTLENAVHQAVKDDKKAYDVMLEQLTGETGVKLGDYRKLLDGFITTQSETYVKGIEEAIKAAGTLAEQGMSVVEKMLSSTKTKLEAYIDNLKGLGGKVGKFFGIGGADYTDGVSPNPVEQKGKYETEYRANANQTITIITTLDGEVISKKTVNQTDALMGQLAELKARGYASTW